MHVVASYEFEEDKRETFYWVNKMNRRSKKYCSIAFSVMDDFYFMRLHFIYDIPVNTFIPILQR